VVEKNVAPGPVDILGVCSYAVVLQADAIAKLIEKPGFRRCVLRIDRGVHVLHPYTNQIVTTFRPDYTLGRAGIYTEIGVD